MLLFCYTGDLTCAGYYFKFLLINGEVLNALYYIKNVKILISIFNLIYLNCMRARSLYEFI